MHREEYQDKRMIMAKYSRLTVATQMYETGMAPVFYHKDLEVANDVEQILLRRKHNTF
jgi:hypothetical protein